MLPASMAQTPLPGQILLTFQGPVREAFLTSPHLGSEVLGSLYPH